MSQKEFSPNIEIIQIREEYIESYHACFDSIAKERIYLARLEAPPLEEVAEYTKKNIAKGNIHLVALIDDRVVGWCGIPRMKKEGFRHCGVLGMGVHKNFRGKGLGKSLMNTAITKAKEQGLERIELEVYSINAAAVHLYKQAGFEVEGIKKKARKLDGIYSDNLCMALFL